MSNKSKVLKPFGTGDGIVFRLGRSKELPKGTEIPLSLEETFDLIDNLRTAYERHFELKFGGNAPAEMLREYMKHAEEKNNEEVIHR